MQSKKDLDKCKILGEKMKFAVRTRDCGENFEFETDSLVEFLEIMKERRVCIGWSDLSRELDMPEDVIILETHDDYD